MSYKQEPTDNVDYDRYLDFDQAILSPTSSSVKGKAIDTPSLRTPTSNSEFLAQQQQQQHNTQSMFSGPSHQYDQHPQQTGLPPGALANALAANKNTAFHMGGYTNTNTLGSSSAVDFDFNAPMPQQFDSTDMDIDFNTPMDGFYGGPNTGFVDPSFIGGQEELSPVPQRSEVVRVWPGMHTHQAEIAKQQQQQEILRQQQAKATQQPQQQPQQQAAPGHKRNGSKNNAGVKPATDPIVEERISRLLNQMRNNSVASSVEDNNSNSQSSSSQTLRAKKDEEDMDEDERLLASEEGKKLSSKERRQLRNKVSARAFRSRRKEYIGQLEGELSLKGQENDDLRAENDALKAENNRLTDLSKMLLSSSAFSNFLNDLSANGMPAPASLTSQALPTPNAQQSQQQQSQVPKDVGNSRGQSQLHQQSSMHIGMTMIPEQSMDFMVASNGNWNSNSGMDYQVYAVTELPEPKLEPIDTGILSGKTNNFVPSFSESKDDSPIIEGFPKSEFDVHIPAPKVEEPVASVIDESVPFDESDPAFALFVDAQPALVKSTSKPQELIFGEFALEKAVARFNLAIESEQSTDEDVSAAAMARFEGLCSSLDSVSTRIASVTAHL